jgi:serine/threonine protein kinase/Tol biopolymer transport system component
MNAERWQQIDELFHAALACEPAQRSTFLAKQCAGDDKLRHEVESLLASLEGADDFIETPAGDVAAEFLGIHKPTFEHGQQIENYRIVHQLGSGGMGEVYLAEDVRLNRKVALKLLPPHFTVNPDRVRRFEREARAASALNHPNIVTIYEIGHSKTTHFIATEFVDGKTLRQLINEKPFTLNETLNVSMQIADALSGAHAAGIVHRDIKPENVMIRRDGYVKILDFGLAKLTEQQIIGSDLETPTLLQSNPGLVMGTVQYMSPEQARAKNVGVGTDIWSLGIVMYELLAGHVPFDGETPSHVMVSLMEDELRPLSSSVSVPAELGRIVDKALRKNQTERYRTARELGRELKNLKRRLQLDAHSRAFLGDVPSRERTKRDGQQGAGVTGARVTRTDTADADPTANAEPVARPVTLFKKKWMVALALTLMVGVFAFVIYQWPHRDRSGPKPSSRFQTTELVRLTNSGKAQDAAISSDGRYVAYVVEMESKQSIWLREMATAHETQIVSAADTIYYGSTFSRDGSYLYYIDLKRNNTIGELYRVSVRGSVPEKVVADVDGPISLSPDGKQIAFVRGWSTGERAVIILNVDDRKERKLASRMGYDAFAFNGLAWSPDGAQITCAAAYGDQNVRYLSLVSVSVSDGSLKQLSGQQWKSVGRINWLADGSGLVFTGSKMDVPSTSQVWYVPYPNGEPQRVTRDLQDYEGLSVTADARTLVGTQQQTTSNLWIASAEDANLGKQIYSQKKDDTYDPFYSSRTRFSWAPNGQIIYTSLATGNENIWSMSTAGNGNNQLTNDLRESTFPSTTADGRYIVFISNRSGPSNVWRMDSDGANQRRLTAGEDDSWAWCSPDSRWVIFHSAKQGFRTVWQVSLDGTDLKQLTDYPSVCPVVSPDGQWIVVYYRLETKAPWKLGIIPFNGGRPVRTMAVPNDVEFRSLVRWTPDGSSLAYIVNREGVSNIWVQPLDGRPASQMTNFKSDKIFWFDWSPDNKQLGVSHGTVTSDVVLIRDTTAQ